MSDDIRRIFINAHGENEEMMRLCQDHSDPLILHDDKPVMDITQDEFVGIFNLNANHYFLSPVQASRFGIYCKLPLPNLIALMLKAEWEQFIFKMAQNISGSKADPGSILVDQDLGTMYISDFKPDKGRIYKRIRNNSISTFAGLSYSQVDFLMSDLLKRKAFLFGNEQISRLYPETEITEELFLSKIPKPKQDEYIRLKELWKIKSTELDNMLLNLERRKRVNMGTENKYLRFFGYLEAEKVKLVIRLKFYRAVLGIKQDQPGLSNRELIKAARDKFAGHEKELRDLENKIKRSRNYIEDIIPKGSVSEVSHEYRNAYMNKCKDLLKKLYFLLHSDTCPGYDDLSGKKKEEINELWLELMKSTKDELFSFSPSMLLYSYPDYRQLLSIYERACLILGIDTDCYDIGDRLEFMLRSGASIEAILDFLNTETVKTELHLARLEIVQDEYTNEDQTRLYSTALENINVHSDKLKAEIEELKIQIKEIKKRITGQIFKEDKQ